MSQLYFSPIFLDIIFTEQCCVFNLIYSIYHGNEGTWLPDSDVDDYIITWKFQDSIVSLFPVLICQWETRTYCVTYAWFAWRIITGSGLDLLALLLQLQSIMAAHNRWLSTTLSIPCWTMSVFPSAWLTWFWFTSRPLLQLPLSAG
jgi:hypothetical protein